MKIGRFVVICALTCLAGAPLARADDCDVIAPASIAQAKVPHSVSHSMTSPGKPPQAMDMIFAGDKVYMQMDGKWQSMPYAAQDQIDMINAGKDRAAKTPHTCQKSAGGLIGGEPSTLYTMHANENGKVSDAQFWLSNKTGLPLKSVIRIADGLVVTDEFSYDGVKPPAGVK